MKYFYNGELVRTSKHEYRFGLLNHLNGIISCSAKRENLQREINKEIAFNEKQIAYLEKRVNEGHNREYLEEKISGRENLKKWQIVELEVREI